MDFKVAQDEATAYWQDVLTELGVDSKAFRIKKEFNGHVSIYSTEFGFEVFYVELMDRNWEPTKERRLLSLKGRANYDAVFNKGKFQNEYLVPIEDFKEVILNKKDVTDAKLSTMEDMSFASASLRDIAAVLWQKPVSKKEWVNALVNENNK